MQFTANEIFRQISLDLDYFVCRLASVVFKSIITIIS